jgi:hypothetical protein
MTSLLTSELKIAVAGYKKEDFDDKQDLFEKMSLYVLMPSRYEFATRPLKFS